MNVATTNQRKRFRFSLLAILVVVLLIGSTIGWIGSIRTRYANQQKAAMALEGLAISRTWHKRVFSNPSSSFDEFDTTRLSRARQQGPALVDSLEIPPLMVRLVAGKDYVPSVRSAKLQHLDLHDEDVVHLRHFQDLTHVNLDNTGITDNAIGVLSRIPNLEYLCLGQTTISDAGLKELNRLEKLSHLDLWINDISDAGLQHLAKLKTLRNLNVCMTNVTESGVQDLQSALPNCHIWWDGHDHFRRINMLPTYSHVPKNYNPLCTIRVCNYFHALGREKTLDAMREYARFAANEASGSPPEYCQTRLRSLISCLFKPKYPESGIPQAPGLQTNVPIVHTWPGSSLYLEGDIPFARATFFPPGTGRMRLEGCEWLLSWAELYCTFRPTQLRPVDDPQSAIQQHMQKWSADDPATLRRMEQKLEKQINRMLEEVQGEAQRIAWNEESQRYEAANPNQMNE